MGLKDDVQRYREVGEEKRPDLEEFIQQKDLSASDEDNIRLPFKVLDLPKFEYEQKSKGGIGQSDGDVEEGQVVEIDEDAEGEDGDDDSESDEPGDGEGDVEYYEIDPEEFARELDEELGLDLEPKGKKIKEKKEGAYVDRVRTGPSSTLDFDYLFKQGLKRKLAVDFDEEYARECLKVSGVGPARAFEYLRSENVLVSRDWLEKEYEMLNTTAKTKWSSLEEFEQNVERTSVKERLQQDGLENIPFRTEDEQYKYPEIEKERQSQVVVINIRDVSGSMREKKRDLVERTMAPMDWYLQGKYDNAVFFYIAHNNEAWTVERAEFFGLRSGGGTRVSTAYELAEELLLEFPFEDWNRYVFAAGDGENSADDTEENVIPFLKEIDANMHAYIETNPGQSNRRAVVADTLEEEFGDDAEDVVVTRVNGADDVIPAIVDILG